MPLIDDVQQVCARLGPLGWGKLLLDKHGLDISKADLGKELARDLTPDGIKRSTPGFEDFAREGRRGIEPEQPARSLLYHALASPNVLKDAGGQPLGDFPTAAELEKIENYVFGVKPPTLAELQTRVQGAALAVVVFALEYRPGSQTCHKFHADLVFARTGVARVGTAEPLYNAQRRGFVAVVEDDAQAMRVSPARYAAFLAVQLPGEEASFRPMRFQTSPRPDNKNDSTRKFWVPIHKLFPGTECLKGLGQPLQITLTPHHANEKLRRIHLQLGKGTNANGTPFDTGVDPTKLDQPPFHFTAGIAEFSTSSKHAPGTLVPKPQPLVAAAEFQGKPLSFNVPPNPSLLSTSLNISTPGSGQGAPEYVHIRTQVRPTGTQLDLNTKKKLRAIVAGGDYAALHYLDFTGDGWIEVASPQLGALKFVPAYSLVTPPDFFPSCDQRELTEWTEKLPDDFKSFIWETRPATLSDQRYMPNLQLRNGPFRKGDRDTTATALVSLFGPVSTLRTESPPADTLRHSHIPDDSAGVFAPGWDVSIDVLPDGTQHLAGYGLGSPFPEDAKLCAALSTFWPAAAPDATRTFEYGPLSNRYFTVSPLTDEEIGQVGTLPWDGVAGPQVVKSGGKEFAEYNSIDYADYVASAIQNQFSLRVTAHIVQRIYQDRVLAMALAYKMLGVANKKDKQNWVVLSFRTVTPGDPEAQDAQQSSQPPLTLLGDAYRFEVFHNPKAVTPSPKFRKVRLLLTDRRVLFVDPVNRRVLMKVGNGPWKGKQFATL